MKEKIVIIFIALAIGLFITTIGFYFYQSNKNSSTANISKNQGNKQNSQASKTLDINGIILTVDQPQNEDLTNKRVIAIKGKTNPENTIIVSSNTDDVIESPASNGSFSVNIPIDTGSNILIIRAVSPNGEEKNVQRIVTYSTEEF